MKNFELSLRVPYPSCHDGESYISFTWLMGKPADFELYFVPIKDFWEPLKKLYFRLTNIGPAFRPNRTKIKYIENIIKGSQGKSNPTQSDPKYIYVSVSFNHQTNRVKQKNCASLTFTSQAVSLITMIEGL